MMLCHQFSRLFHPIIRKTSSSKDLEKGSMLLMKRKKFTISKDLVDSLKQQKLVSDAELHLLEQNFDGVGKYLFENQIANSKQASKQAICHGCRLWASNTHTYFCANW